MTHRIRSLGVLLLCIACTSCNSSSQEQAIQKERRVGEPSLYALRLQQIRRMFPRAMAGSPVSSFAQHSDTLRVTNWRVGPRVPNAQVTLPIRSDGKTGVEDLRSQLGITVALQAARPVTARVVDGLVMYLAGGPEGSDVIQRVHPGGTEDFVLLTHALASPELRYRVEVSQVAGLRLVSDTLEFLADDGTPHLRMAPPYLIDARGRWQRLRTRIEGCAVDRSPRAPWGREVTPPGAHACTVVVSWSQAGLRYPVLVDPEWVSTFNTMIVERTQHTMTRLMPDSATSWLVVAGGFDAAGLALDVAELYDPISRTFAVTSTMVTPRGQHTATPLTTIPASPNQLVPVLLAGGRNSEAGIPLPVLEVYNPATGLFHTDTNVMDQMRYNHTATLFDDNKVLITGGRRELFDQPIKTAYVYTFTQIDPSGAVDSTLQDTVYMSTERSAHTATRLLSGQVLITGGFSIDGGALTSAELYTPHASGDPSLATFNGISALGAATNAMSVPRARHSATLLASGAVLIVGGRSNFIGGLFADVIDVFHDGVADPSIRGFETFSPPISLTYARAGHTATRLPNGQVIVAGGMNSSETLSSAERIDPTAWPPMIDTVSTTTSMTVRRDHAAAAVTAGGSVNGGVGVLVCGGRSATTVIDSAQVLLKVDGEGCDLDSDCLSGYCTEGVCCDTRCDAECASCTAAGKGNGADGVCGHAAAGGALGTECLGHTEVQLQCDGNGQAVAASTLDCAPYTCDATGIACLDFCDSGSTCSATGWCDVINNTCLPKGVDSAACSDDAQCLSDNCVEGVCCSNPCLLGETGTACSVPGDCLSGNCANGVCCDTACGGECFSCTAAGKGTGVDGVCGPSAAGTDLGTVCLDGIEVSRECDGTGQTLPTVALACAPGTCDAAGDACTDACTDHSDCAETGWCDDSTGACVLKLDDGEACTEAAQCATNSCVNDVCCAVPCAAGADAGVTNPPSDEGGCRTAGRGSVNLLMLVLLTLLVGLRRRRQGAR